jgi:hypothetical protein
MEKENGAGLSDKAAMAQFLRSRPADISVPYPANARDGTAR